MDNSHHQQNSDPMYQQYCRNELARETISNVIDGVADDKKKVEKKLSVEISEDCEKLREQLMEEYRIKNDNNDWYEIARSHWIQLQKTKQQNTVIRNCFLIMLEKYPHIRPIWGFGKQIEEMAGGRWKNELNEDFYFRHHCASIQSAIDLILKNKDDHIFLRKILNEMGGHHLFYDACEPHFQLFQESFITSMRKSAQVGEEMNESVELSWIQLLETIRIHMSEGIEIQRIKYLKQCFTPIEIEDIKITWKSVDLFGFEKAGTILCDVAFKKYLELAKTYNMSITLPEAARKNSSSYKELTTQIIKAIDITIKSYSPQDGFISLIGNIQGFVIKFLVVDVSPPLIRKSFTEGLIEMICKVLKTNHLKEDTLHIWNKIYRVMEQSMMANIVDY